MPVSFRLAPMSGLIRALTLILCLLPIAMLLQSVFDPRAAPLTAAGVLLLLIYAVIWSSMRPRAFVVREDGLEIVWPLRRKWIPRADITGAEEIGPRDLRREFGLLLRLGAGGLWGGFGLALSTRGRHLGLLVSRHRDGFVLLRCERSRSILMTPERPADFVAAIRSLA